MAAAHKVVAVDLGASTIKFGEFSIGRGGALALLRFGVAELGLDPNKEEDRARFITPTLAKLFQEHRVKGREVLLSISGQSAIYNGEHLTYYVRHPSPLFPNVSELTYL